jgi:Domain of unknown function (DUF222)/HNH endonuclease
MDVVANLLQALELFAHADPFSSADRDSLVALQAGRASYDSSLSAVVASFAQGGEWAAEGAQSAAAWLATVCHLPLREARAQVRRGAALGSMPVVAEAFAQGAIGTAQVDQLVKARSGVAVAAERGAGVDPEAFARCEADLVHSAQELKFGAFCDVVSYFSQRADPLGADESDMAKAARRDAFLHQSAFGMYLGAMTLDPFSGAIVAGELHRLETELFEADWAKAKESLGRDPRIDQLGRTSAQRRADALVAMAVRSKGAKETDRRPEPLFSILVGYESLHGRICQIEGGPIVAPGSLLPWLEHASFERIVFSPQNRIECSTRSRFFTGATRRAIAVRDQCCTHPFCERPSEQCQIDHIVPYAQGGETTQENGRVLCGFHNRLRNQGQRGQGGDEEGEGGGEGDVAPDDEGGP